MALLGFSDCIEDAAQYKKKHVLLGNGFSIACRPSVFAYGKLYEQAKFSKISASAKFGFEALGTQDFEKVIKALRDTAAVLKKYSGSIALVQQLSKDADGLRELLVQTIAASHPAKPDEINEHEYSACRSFLENFDTIYTFNYDLLLYWARMHVREDESP